MGGESSCRMGGYESRRDRVAVGLPGDRFELESSGELERFRLMEVVGGLVGETVGETEGRPFSAGGGMEGGGTEFHSSLPGNSAFGSRGDGSDWVGRVRR